MSFHRVESELFANCFNSFAPLISERDFSLCEIQLVWAGLPSTRWAQISFQSVDSAWSFHLLRQILWAGNGLFFNRIGGLTTHRGCSNHYLLHPFSPSSVGRNPLILKNQLSQISGLSRDEYNR